MNTIDLHVVKATPQKLLTALQISVSVMDRSTNECRTKQDEKLVKKKKTFKSTMTHYRVRLAVVD